jgi:hypothetical protein
MSRHRMLVEPGERPRMAPMIDPKERAKGGFGFAAALQRERDAQHANPVPATRADKTTMRPTTPASAEPASAQEECMAPAPIVQVSSRLAHDSDAGIREIGQRCMREYDEFAGMKYAHLTARDAALVTAAAQRARAGNDDARATLLDSALLMIRSALGAA